MKHLCDTNAFIAVAVQQHVHHDLAEYIAENIEAGLNNFRNVPAVLK